jgi:hypothetical protein
MKDEDIDRTQPMFAFRCTGRCFNQFALSDVLTNERTGELHCPICKGLVRQLLSGDGLCDAWGAYDSNPDYKTPTFLSKLKKLLNIERK